MQISSDAKQIAITYARNRNSASGTRSVLFSLVAMHRPGHCLTFCFFYN